MTVLFGLSRKIVRLAMVVPWSAPYLECAGPAALCYRVVFQSEAPWCGHRADRQCLRVILMVTRGWSVTFRPKLSRASYENAIYYGDLDWEVVEKRRQAAALQGCRTTKLSRASHENAIYYEDLDWEVVESGARPPHSKVIASS